ncbi:MAG: C45 family autoproteolytic acyltransferase/hydrolase [Proteobacteria bacterium]|nr:C45 family autoproteolytic acyltransferase/hydrolase [Pseudomonadota bacterium]
MKTFKTVSCLMCICGLLFFCAAPAAPAASLPRMYPTCSYQGSWKEIGKQTAMHYGDTIMYTGIVFNNFMNIGAEETLAYYDEIKGRIPAAIQEQMEGLAQGLNEYWSVPYDTAWTWVLVANLGFDIMSKHTLDKEVQGCTAFALHSDQGTFLCHNTDNASANVDLGSLIYYQPDNGDNAFLSFFAAAFVGAALAVNDKGLAVTYNVGGRNKNPAAGLTVLLKTREVMATCGSVAEAVESFKTFLDAGGTYGYATSNFLFVDFKDSSMARLQVSSREIKVTYGQELKPGVTYIGFTNEFDDDFSPRTEADLAKTSVISSQTRYKRLMELLPAFEKYDLETCWEILTDKSGGESDNNTICRRGQSTITTLANIFTADTAYYAVGPPCEYLALYGAPMAVGLEQKVQPSIGGSVTALGRPLAHVPVVLESTSMKGMTLKTCTDGNGAYLFNNLESDTYRLRVKKFPHVPGRKVVDFQKGTQQTIDLNLLF